MPDATTIASCIVNLLAHTDPRLTGNGLTAGLMHPLSGVDHVLALICVGVLAGRAGGRGRWLAPLSLIASLIVGGSAGMMGFPARAAELAISASLIVVGLAVAIDRRPNVVLLTLVAGLVGAIHGHAHGTEMTTLAAAIPYGVGFIASSCGLLWVGMTIGGLALRDQRGMAALRWTGRVVAVVGICFAVMLAI